MMVEEGDIDGFDPRNAEDLALTAAERLAIDAHTAAESTPPPAPVEPEHVTTAAELVHLPELAAFLAQLDEYELDHTVNRAVSLAIALGKMTHDDERLTNEAENVYQAAYYKPSLRLPDGSIDEKSFPFLARRLVDRYTEILREAEGKKKN